MSFKYGHTAIACKMCKTVTAIDNQTLEKLTEHICPVCNKRMTDRELGRMKMHLYLLWEQIYKEHCGPMVELFDYEISLTPSVEQDK